MSVNSSAEAVEGVSGVPRRTIVKGAAWSVPVIATSMALPSASASVLCEPGSQEWLTATTGGTFTLPDCVTTFTFEIIGGGGAGYRNGGGASGSGTTASSTRQNGARFVGQATVPAGSTLSLVVGDGGKYTTAVGAAGAGGVGFGNGGAGGVVPSGANPSVAESFGGGGGSAILLGGTPLIVAGGGGGFASFGAIFSSGSGGWGYGVNGPTGTVIETPRWGADYGSSTAGAVAENGGTRTFAYTRLNDAYVTDVVGAGPGLAATGSAGGTGGADVVHLDSSTSIVDPNARAIGTVGGSNGTGNLGGGDGGVGVTAKGTWHAAEGATSGGGGGGWAGGGSGGAFAGWSSENLSGSYMYFGVAGYGGAGSSYTDAGIATVTSAGSSAIPVQPDGMGHVGLIRISWS